MQATHHKIRSFFIFVLLCGGYLCMIARLYYIQIKHGEYYRTLAQQQYEVTMKAYPPRALILDRYEQPLAMNRQVVSAFITPCKINQRSSLQTYLQQHYPHALTRLHANQDSAYLFVQRALSDQQVEHIRATAGKDVYLMQEPGRYYPLPAAASIIGFTDTDNKGICGLELFFNTQLTGTPTVAHVWKDARSGYYTTEQATAQGQQGQPLITSIDSTLQFLAQEEVIATMQEFKASEGAALIIDPSTGEVLAMVSQPSFDPNDRSALDLECTKNRTVTELYELGSVIKVCSALAALEEGVVTPDELIDCEGVSTTYVNGRKINTARKTEAGMITFSRVIEKSNNIGIAKVALRLQEKLYDHYRRMGFDQLTGIEFPGERIGCINSPRSWSKQSVISLSYGYEIAITLAQLARFFCMIAQDGREVQLTLQRRTTPYTGKQLYSSASISTLRTILENTTLHGTTHRARIKGYTIMSKSGTANLLMDGHYTTEKGIFTCAGIIQKGAYQRVIVVFIKEAQGNDLFASIVAAPLFERIAQKILIHDKVLS